MSYFSYTCGVATISLLKLAFIVVKMESRMGIWDISKILKMVVRRASPPVNAYEGSSYV
jgi:hypothetical protein